MKIKAYTIMEVTIAMLLFAIVVSICYSAYGIVNTYYSSFHQKSKIADEVISLKGIMENDFIKANSIVKSEEGFSVTLDTSKIIYAFKEQLILRTLNGSRTDSFKVQHKDLATYFELHQILTLDTIDQINFVVTLNKKIDVPLQINKHYSAKDLFN